MQHNPNKIFPLESMRGIAAFVVLVFHFILGFAPQRHGQEAQSAIKDGNLLESPLFFLINGHAAVFFFFVLSGFVLSYKFFQRQTNDGLTESVIKRWPRLFPLAMISTVLSWVFLNLDWYAHREAAAITKSQWMGSFAYSSGDLSQMDFFDSFMQGFFYSFFRGDQSLNTSLWTMRYEFIGSLLVFGLIPILNGARKRVALILLLVTLAVCYHNHMTFSAFIAGCFLSYYRAQVRKDTPLFTSNWVSLTLAILVVFIGFNFYTVHQPMFAFMGNINPVLAEKLRTIFYVTASICLIQLILNHKWLYDKLNGKIGIFLGRCSFAIYVMHVPIMFTCGTAAFLFMLPHVGYSASVFAAFIATCVPTFLLAWYLTLADERWCRAMNRLANQTTQTA